MQAAGATGLPTVLVTPSATATEAMTTTTTPTPNGAARLALPALLAGETGRVALSGFSAAQQPVALEMTPRCVLGLAGRDAGVAVGGFVPPPGGGSNYGGNGNGDVRTTVL